MKPTSDEMLLILLQRMDPHASQVQRHLWLYDVLAWIRGSEGDVQRTIGRLRQLLIQVQKLPDWLPRWQQWWQQFTRQIDVTPLLADFGFAPRTAFLSEVAHRLQRKWIPLTPDTTDAAQLFNLLLPHAFDAQWLRAIDARLAEQLHEVLFFPISMSDSASDGNHQPDSLPTGHTDPLAQAAHHSSTAPLHGLPWQAILSTTSDAWQHSGITLWQASVLDAITYNVSQINATGFASEIRLRMTHDSATTRTFHDLPSVLERFIRAVHAHGVQGEGVRQQAQALREQLQACRKAAGTVYEHLDQHGVSVGIVFMLRQMRERIVRVSDLLECLLSQQPAHAVSQLVGRLVTIGVERRSLRKLWQSSTHLSAAKVAERHAEAGEHYITRNVAEWRMLFLRALGGGAAIGLAVWVKFAIAALALSIFWKGFAAGLNYAVVFVGIYLLHWTVATKQPAVTAPAMAAKLKDMGQPNAVDAFVDEVTHLIRSQIAAITGNIVGVIPAVLLICVALQGMSGHSMLDASYAYKTLASLHIVGPTLVFAAVTGVLLYASSLIAGWTENWFVFHRLDSAIACHPLFRRKLGADRAQRWAIWWRTHISGLAANISLGFMLGLVPSFAHFFGIGLEVRHVTLAAGQIAAAAHALGWDVLHQPGFWYAVLAVALVGPINLAVSFYLAFSTAMLAQNVPPVDRRRINAALRYRMRHETGSFFYVRRPTRKAGTTVQPPAPIPPVPPQPQPPAPPGSA